MRTAVISDIHGNLPALRAVIEEIRSCSVELILCCGDIASGPMPVETMDFLLQLEMPFQSVQGNADEEAVRSFDGVADASRAHEDDLWTGTRLEPRHRDYLDGLPLTITSEMADLGTALLCHGTPRRNDEILTERTPEAIAAETLHDVEADIVFCGNTHMQYDRRVGEVRVVNVGSVGWPYGSPGAYWALADRSIELRRTTYDIDSARAELRQNSTWPRLETFLPLLSTPPKREDALRHFENLAAARVDGS